jgi:competence protein ComEA
LEQLPGIGPVIAGRILTLREKMGRFRVLEDLQAVQGIGSATIERIRPFIIIAG